MERAGLMKLPSLALVTPCFNQAPFIEATLCSVLRQEYPSLQYVVMDAASTDGSREIISRYAAGLHSWTSEKDSGQYDAINKGFARTTGEIMGWINADDLHCPWTLGVVGEIFATQPEVRWMTSGFPLRWNSAGRAVHCRAVPGFSRKALLLGEYTPGTSGFFAAPIQQESTFWRRDLWEEAGGGLDIAFDPASDFELWARFARHAELYTVNVPLAGFRFHGEQRSERERARYQEQALGALRHHGRKEASPAWHTALRPVCRDRLPQILRPAAVRAGLLFPAKRLVHSRGDDKWEIENVLV
jgi:glycosyltransferase involved in cell wall biosynthesis